MEIDADLVGWGLILRHHRLRLNSDGDVRGETDASMTQKELGNQLDPPVAQSTVAKWESGAAEPRRRYREQIRDVLGAPELYVGSPDAGLVAAFRRAAERSKVAA